MLHHPVVALRRCHFSSLELHVPTTSTTEVPFFAMAFSKAFLMAALVLRTEAGVCTARRVT